MNWKLPCILFACLAVIACCFGALVPLSQSRHLGSPGIRTKPLPDGRCRILLPDLDGYVWQEISLDQTEIRTLPQDTSFGRRIYEARDGFKVLVNVVLMGTDRTSIHKPEFCLTSQGWRILEQTTKRVMIEKPHPYELKAREFLLSKIVRLSDGQAQPIRGVYIFWFVSGERLASGHFERMWWTSWDLLWSGKLPRWAYIGCFTACYPGMEKKAEERIVQFIKQFVPAFQLATAPQVVDVTH